MVWEDLFEKKELKHIVEGENLVNHEHKYRGEMCSKQREKDSAQAWGKTCTMCLKRKKVSVSWEKWVRRVEGNENIEVDNRFMLGFVGKLKMLAFNFHVLNRHLLEDFVQEVAWSVTLERIPLAVVLRINFKGAGGQVGR